MLITISDSKRSLHLSIISYIEEDIIQYMNFDSDKHEPYFQNEIQCKNGTIHAEILKLIMRYCGGGRYRLTNFEDRNYKNDTTDCWYFRYRGNIEPSVIDMRLYNPYTNKMWKAFFDITGMYSRLATLYSIDNIIEIDNSKLFKSGKDVLENAELEQIKNTLTEQNQHKEAIDYGRSYNSKEIRR